MANEMERNPGLRLDVESLWTNLEQVRRFAASQEAQEKRTAAMSTPTGEALYAGIRRAFEAVEVPGDAEFAAAQAELLGIARAAGASRELVGQLQQVMADPSLLEDESYAAQLSAQVSGLDMAAAQAVYHPSDWQPDRFAGQQPAGVGASTEAAAASGAAAQHSEQADTAAQVVVSDAGVTAGGIHQLLQAAYGLDDPGTTHIGPDVPPDQAISADTLVLVPTADVTPEQVAEYDRRARAYAETQSMDVDHVDEDNKLDNYSSLVMYLTDTKDDDELDQDNVTPEDYNIISNLSYARKFSYDGGYRIAASRQDLSIQEYCDALLAADAMAAESKKMSDKDRAFLIALRNNKRYANLHIDHVDAMDVGDVNTNIVTFSTRDGKHAFISIQGTNGTVDDWVNNMEFSRDEVSEEEAWINERVSKYLHEYESFDATGHSQGGRDAITMAALLDPENRKRLRRVFSLDGPGYPHRFLEKYSDDFKAIEDKIYQIFPADSYVGHLMERVGLDENCKYILPQKQDGMLFDFLIHDNARWVIRNTDGQPGYIYTEQTVISKIIRHVSTVAVNEMPPEVLNEVLPIIFYLLAGTEDPTQLEGPVLERLSASDAAEVASVLLVALSDCVLELMEKLEPDLNIAKGILTVASQLPWGGAIFCKAALKVLKMVDSILGAIEKISEVLSAYLEWKSEQKRAAREAYLASHGNITMDYTALRNAAKYMEEASKALEVAGEYCDAMWNCFKKDEAVEDSETDAEGVLHAIWHVVAMIVDPVEAINQALRRLALGGIDFTCLKSNPYCLKGADAIVRVITSAKAIQTGCGYLSEEDVFTVNPSTLAAKGQEGEKAAENMLKSLRDTDISVRRLGTSWQSEDYTNLCNQMNVTMKNMQTVLGALKGDYVGVQQIAQAYSIMQQTAVKEFQAAAN